MQNQIKSFLRIRLLLDIFSLLLALLVSIEVNNKFEINIYKLEFYSIFVYQVIVWIILSRSTNLYDELRTKSIVDEFIPLIKMMIYQTISVIVLIFFFKDVSVNRFFVVTYSILLLSFSSFARFFVRIFLSYIRKKGRNIKKILIVGWGEVAQNFYKTVQKSPQFGFKVIGFLDDYVLADMSKLYLGKISHLDYILRTRNINDVFIILPYTSSNLISQIITTCEFHTKRVRIIPSFSPFISERFVLSKFDRFPILNVRSEKLNELESRVIKRLFDSILSILIIVFILSWLFPIIAILIKIDSPGKIFFKKERGGRDNSKFNIYKFRSMYEGVPTTTSDGKHLQTLKNDKRITKIGKYIRKYNIDELPQIINILKGEMTFVGPRPHSTPLNLQSKTEVPGYMVRQFVKPGLTGWAQVNGFRGETKTPEIMQKRIEHDIWYIENWSFGLDLHIIFLTLWQMVKGDKNAY